MALGIREGRRRVLHHGGTESTERGEELVWGGRGQEGGSARSHGVYGERPGNWMAANGGTRRVCDGAAKRTGRRALGMAARHQGSEAGGIKGHSSGCGRMPVGFVPRSRCVSRLPARHRPPRPTPAGRGRRPTPDPFGPGAGCRVHLLSMPCVSAWVYDPPYCTMSSNLLRSMSDQRLFSCGLSTCSLLK